MYRKKSWISSLTTGLALALGLAICSEPVITMAQQYNPPRRGTPKRREGAGTRGSCLTGTKPVTPLIPIDQFGTTVSSQPTFFWYVPPKSAQASDDSAKSAEFSLYDKNNTLIKTWTFALSGYSGIASFTLPDPTLLQMDQEYTWQFSVICDAEAPSKNPFVEGIVQRVQPSEALNRKLAVATPNDQASLFASSGIWYDSLKTLAGMRCSSPGDIGVTLSWASLLRSVELTDIASESFNQYCAQIGTTAPQPSAGSGQPAPVADPQ